MKAGKYRAQPVKRRWIILTASRSAGQASRRVAALSRSMQSRLRLLLGTEPPQSQALAGASQDQREEVPSRIGGALGLAEEIAEPPAPRNHCHPPTQAARALELLRSHWQLGSHLALRTLCEATGVQVAQPAQRAQKLHVGDLRARVGALGSTGPTNHREALAPDRWTIPTRRSMTESDNKKPIMIEVPPARILEEPGAVVPHAGICEGGVGQPTSLP